jgi:hypothetical protein
MTMRTMTTERADRPARNRLAAWTGSARSAIAVGAGIGGLSFVTVWMYRYQLCIIAVSLLVVLWWLSRTIRDMTAGRGDGPPWRRLAGAGRPALVRAAACLGSYELALALAMGISAGIRVI